VRQLGLSDARKVANFLAHHGQAGGDGLADASGAEAISIAVRCRSELGRNASRPIVSRGEHEVRPEGRDQRRERGQSRCRPVESYLRPKRGRHAMQAMLVRSAAQHLAAAPAGATVRQEWWTRFPHPAHDGRGDPKDDMAETSSRRRTSTARSTTERRCPKTFEDAVGRGVTFKSS